MAHDREMGGIRCLQVLEHLSEYVDGEIDPIVRRSIDEHLAGCDWCAMFGGRFRGLVLELRQRLRFPTGDLDPGVSERLRRRIGSSSGE